jgi:hypothetical protein
MGLSGHSKIRRRQNAGALEPPAPSTLHGEDTSQTESPSKAASQFNTGDWIRWPSTLALPSGYAMKLAPAKPKSMAPANKSLARTNNSRMRYSGRRGRRGIMMPRPWECDAAKAIIFRSGGVDLFGSCFSAGPVADKQAALGLPHPGAVSLTRSSCSSLPAPVSAPASRHAR